MLASISRGLHRLWMPCMHYHFEFECSEIYFAGKGSIDQLTYLGVTGTEVVDVQVDDLEHHPTIHEGETALWRGENSYEGTELLTGSKKYMTS